MVRDTESPFVFAPWSRPIATDFPQKSAKSAERLRLNRGDPVGALTSQADFKVGTEHAPMSGFRQTT